MSTPTPRTDAEAFRPYRGDRDDQDVNADFARTLETELTAALARIAELEGELESHAFSLSPAMVHARNDQLNAQIDSLTRQLSESQAQLASAREDGARLDWLDSPEGSIQPVMRLIRNNGEAGNPPLTYRSAIDSARGATSPPAVVETGEKDAWQDIATAPKDGTDILLYLPYRIIEGGAMKAGSWLGHAWTYEPPDESWYNPTHWQPLPPPPQGKEKAPESTWKSIETAPKDGTRILLYGVEKPGEAYHLFEGWFDVEWWATFGNDDVHNVSHWQPLPPPPQGKEKE